MSHSGLGDKAKDFVGVCAHLYEYSYNDGLGEESLPLLADALLAAFAGIKTNRDKARGVTTPSSAGADTRACAPITTRAPTTAGTSSRKAATSDPSDSNDDDDSSSSGSDIDDIEIISPAPAPPTELEYHSDDYNSGCHSKNNYHGGDEKDDEAAKIGVTEESHPTSFSSPTPAHDEGTEATIDSKGNELAQQIHRAAADVKNARERPSFTLGGGHLPPASPKRKVVWKKINGKNVRVVLEDSDSD